MISFVTPAEALAFVKSGSSVFIQTAAAAPRLLVEALAERAPQLRDVRIFQMHTEGEAPYGAPGMERSFDIQCFFVGANLREAVRAGRAHYIPAFLSQVPALFRSGEIPVDVALIQVSPPDRHGFCSLGVSVDIAPAALSVAKFIIAQVNPNMPRTLGDAGISVNRIAAFVACDDPIHEWKTEGRSEIGDAIGRHVASLVDDGAMVQVGIGKIPEAVLRSLGGHRRLGIHSEMFSDGVVDLVEKGVVTGEHHPERPGKLVSSFLLGTRKLYDFVDDNPMVEMRDIAYVNDPVVIGRNHRMTSINCAIEVDVTGQVCADSIGNRIYSGVGGQLDFVRGARISRGGRSIIALPSVTRTGESRIVPMLKSGAGVVTTRADVDFLVTEFGVAALRGRSLRDRAKAIAQIAHPDHREGLQPRKNFSLYSVLA